MSSFTGPSYFSRLHLSLSLELTDAVVSLASELQESPVSAFPVLGIQVPPQVFTRALGFKPQVLLHV